MNKLEQKTREIMRRFNIRPNKKLGQNFLIDQGVLDSIIDAGEVNNNDMIIEIGPGLGVLTPVLCENAGKVVTIELDRNFISILEDVLSRYDNFEIVQGDVLSLDLQALIQAQNHHGDVKVVANLPYYITTPVIMKLLEEELKLKSITVMVQKEVAERIAAGPGGKEYGVLSIAVAYYGKSNIVLEVPPSSFVPPPGVSSSVIRIDIYGKPPVEINDKKTFFKLVRAAFGQRRKTVLNSLTNSGMLGGNKDKIKQLLNSVGIEEIRRPETLSISEFANLSNELAEINK